jgi:two-component system chemotaxis sensor kinase CheA
MDKRDDEFLKRIKETFRVEAEEHLNAFLAGLTGLEKPQSEESYCQIIEAMFRDIHSLKGAARSIDQREVESICQPLESVFSGLKNRRLTLTPASLDLFYKTAASLLKIITEPGFVTAVSDRQIHRELIQKLNDISSGILKTPDKIEPKNAGVENVVEHAITVPAENAHDTDIPQSGKPLSSETVRIRISKLDELLIQTEELIQTKKSIHQRIREMEDLSSDCIRLKGELIKKEAHLLMASTGTLKESGEELRSTLNNLENQLSVITLSMRQDKYFLDNIVDLHLDSIRQILMLPVSSIAEVFPVMVRKISGEQEKEINLVMSGTELEIDKRILEELKDPLIHLLRNSIDHGIGKPAERISQNKPATGTIQLTFSPRDNGMVEISLSDDGKGINKENVRKAAIKSGYINRHDAAILEPEKIIQLIFESGISTSPDITDISGHGLGLSIVQEKVEKLNGNISVETELNKGTVFRILLPMTFSAFRGILVMTGESLFILPLVSVERVMKVDLVVIKTVKNHDTILIENRILPIVDLGEVLGLPEYKLSGSSGKEELNNNSNHISIVVVASGENRIAFRVDEVIDEQQVLVKSLGKLLKRVRNISGATVLGSGRVVLVINVTDLIRSALKSTGNIRKGLPAEQTPTRKMKILVADDSITSRTMIKNILETAGYQVLTAVDGTDAFTKARTDKFDLIVSDVDMPRMNGFELIDKIRHDKKLSDIPVVLITALGSKEDREHGIDVGADAYIIKNNFDQFNLIEIIRKLI